MLHIDELKYPIGNGTTKPIVGVAGGRYYVIKTINNSQGNKVLVNELVSYLIATRLRLPIPNAYLCIIDRNTIIDKNVMDMEDFSEDCFGIGFCSEYIEKSTVISSSRMIKLASNYNDVIPKIMLFDHIIHNKDRNRGNILLTTNKNKKELMLIDHSHVFNLETLWDSISLRQKIEAHDFNDLSIMEGNAYLYSKFKEVCPVDIITMQKNLVYFKEIMTNDLFKEVVEYVPEVWENDKEELKTLSDYLIYRFDNIETFAQIILTFRY